MLPPIFDRYVRKVVEYDQYKHELDLSDEEAVDHPDTFSVLRELVEIVEAAPEISATYRAVLDPSSENHTAAIGRVREIEIDVAATNRDIGVLSSHEHRKILRNLLKKAGIIEKARAFQDMFYPAAKDVVVEGGVLELVVDQLPRRTTANEELLETFLFGSGDVNTAELDSRHVLNANSFYDTVTKGVDLDFEVIATAIERFVSALPAAEEEDASEEEGDQLTSHLQSIDVGLSTFIESGTPHKGLPISDTEIKTLQSFYSKANLLHFARSLVEQSNGRQLNSDQLDQIYRYRVVVKVLEDYQLKIEHLKRTVGVPRARLWADNGSRDFGVDVGGRIHGTDYLAFSSEDDREEPGPILVPAGDELVPLTSLRKS